MPVAKREEIGAEDRVAKLLEASEYVPSKMTMSSTPDELRAFIKENNASVDARTFAALAEMYGEGHSVELKSGKKIALDKVTRISIEQGLLLHSLIVNNNVARSLEIGFAFGFSTVWILDALRGKENAKHVAVDPFEKSVWKSVGLTQVEKLGSPADFQWIEDYSIHALSDSIRQKQWFDFIYIDGNHRFDDIIVDFYLCDQVLRDRGLIILDDMWMPSIRSATNFVVANRFYRREPSAVNNAAVLRKLASDKTRRWDNFVPFGVPLA